MTWRLFGRETRNPLAVAVILVLCLLLLPPTLIPHLAARLIGGTGFLRNGRMYEPSAFWTVVSNVVFYGLIFVLVIL